jgi:hypothetical protein
VRKSDLDRVLKALKDAGQAARQIEMRPDGGVLITPGEGLELRATSSDLDEWRTRRAARSADRS